MSKNLILSYSVIPKFYYWQYGDVHLPLFIIKMVITAFSHII
jgi:hypothetical protein